MRISSLALVTCLLGLPVHAQYSGGSGTVDDPYQIATAADLIALGETPDDYDKHFILTADIDLDPNATEGRVFDRAVIAAEVRFTGAFDGNGHAISHLTITGKHELGLFARVDSGGIVSGLAVEAVDVNGTGCDVGSVAGFSYGRVVGCYSTGAVTGYRFVGGLVGQNWGTIEDCHSTTVVTGIREVGGLVGRQLFGSIVGCYSAGEVTGDEAVGGLAGRVGGGIVAASYSAGAVTGNEAVEGLVGESEYGSISNSSSTGTVIGEVQVGGLAGRVNGGTVAASYSACAVTGKEDVGGFMGCGSSNRLAPPSFWYIEASGQAESYGAIGLTVAQMQDADTFLRAGWDCAGEVANGTCDYWVISPGDYPPVALQRR